MAEGGRCTNPGSCRGLVMFVQQTAQEVPPTHVRAHRGGHRLAGSLSRGQLEPPSHQRADHLAGCTAEDVIKGQRELAVPITHEEPAATVELWALEDEISGLLRDCRSGFPSCADRCQHTPWLAPSSCAYERVLSVGQCMPPRRAGGQPLHPIYAPAEEDSRMPRVLWTQRLHFGPSPRIRLPGPCASSRRSRIRTAATSRRRRPCEERRA